MIQKNKDPFIDAVMGVSFTLGEGETLGLVGESGSGKTTLAVPIIGLASVFSGSIKFSGRELVGLPPSAFKNIRRDIAMMFQDPVASLSPRKTVRSLVTEPFKIHGVKDCDYEAEARRLLGMVGLQEGFPGRLSSPTLGRAGAQGGRSRGRFPLHPSVIIADEPTAGLDVSVQGEILNLMSRCSRSSASAT